MNEGKRIYVKTELFEGWATILEFFPGEIYPIQIEMEEPDMHGHSLKRVRKEDIIHDKGESDDV